MDPALLIEQARAARHAGDTAGALDLYRRALGTSGDDAATRAHCQRHIGDLAREMGEPDAARTALREAEAYYRQTDDPLSLANTLRLLALIDGIRDHWEEARALYLRAAATGLPLTEAIAECDRQLASGR